ncbi:hypothetical protein BIV60_20335 [Bacillus sp. MUM 116]|uniref:hypothetical protein n=1 Tax=Bacillus sp. MUM 116 TaxID=1678002 RepID=UPI0008F5C5A2|nr:hypothetical protein [Bacillus sp. MUM 116]OIK10819.1 hypothetical protein BIV60_20335 [Bacillus sp. MUM 116]
MRVRSSLIAPVLAASIFIPTVGTAVVNHKADTSKHATMQTADQKWAHHKWEKGEKQKELMTLINQYATPQLKAQLKKDLATREGLMKQLRQKGKDHEDKSFQAHKKEIEAIKQQVKEGKLTKQQAHKKIEALFGKEHGKDQEDKFFQTHKKEIEAIKQQVKEGKLTKQQAHKKLEALFGKGHREDKDKGKEQGERGIFKSLKTAIQKKDRAAINVALEKFDKQLESLNKELQQKLHAKK